VTSSVHAPFTVPLAVQPTDIDGLGHVNNVVYLRWVQEAAIAHWRSLTTLEEQATVGWVVARHEIDYKHAAMPGDAVTARTWVGVAGRRTFERHTEILRGDGRLLAKARTVWVPVDLATGAVLDVGPGIRQRFSVPADEA
jgi:acyl-CoA thioester hydrolase